jgi:PAS domain S-box-containing protein
MQVGKDGALLRANAEALRILGMSADELSKRDVASFETQTIFEDGSPASVADYPVTRAIATGLPQPALTFGVRHPNGEVTWAVYRAVPTRDPTTQEVNGAVVTSFDITERKRFEDKLRHTQKLESLGVLAGGIAHDFNNLLATILANASFAGSIAGADPRVAPLLQEIELGARRAASLTKQMLDYAGQGKFRAEALDLPAAVQEMARLVKAVIPKQVELFYQFQQSPPPIDVDATQIRQVVMNLITNAAEAIGEAPGRVQISVSEQAVSAGELETYIADAAVPGAFLCLEVADTGSGMDDATLGKVFDPFFTTKFKGRGLGMAAVLGILRAHRAAIRIDSRPGAGTKVRVLFPLEKRRPTLAPTGRRGGILVVDDDGGVQLILRRALTKAGYRVLTASNGLDGLRVFEANTQEIDLVVMDMTMPQLGGLDTLRHMRASGSTVPVLLISGYELDATTAEIREFTAHLQKPFSTAEILAAVERALGQSADADAKPAPPRPD